MRNSLVFNDKYFESNGFSIKCRPQKSLISRVILYRRRESYRSKRRLIYCSSEVVSRYTAALYIHKATTRRRPTSNEKTNDIKSNAAAAPAYSRSGETNFPDCKKLVGSRCADLFPTRADPFPTRAAASRGGGGRATT